jgi:hypothetical protein
VDDNHGVPHPREEFLHLFLERGNEPCTKCKHNFLLTLKESFLRGIFMKIRYPSCTLRNFSLTVLKI